MDNIMETNMLSIEKCPPMVGYLLYVITVGISLYLTKNHFKIYDDKRMDNLYNIHSLVEIKLAVVLGVVIYGLCKNNQDYLAWVMMSLPLLYIMSKGFYVFMSVSSGLKNVYNKEHLLQQNIMSQRAKEQYQMNNRGPSPLDLQKAQLQQLSTSVPQSVPPSVPPSVPSMMSQNTSPETLLNRTVFAEGFTNNQQQQPNQQNQPNMDNQRQSSQESSIMGYGGGGSSFASY